MSEASAVSSSEVGKAFFLEGSDPSSAEESREEWLRAGES